MTELKIESVTAVAGAFEAKKISSGLPPGVQFSAVNASDSFNQI